MGAVKGIKICVDRYSEEDALATGKRLMDCGILNEGEEYKIFYDFTPVTSPVLLWYKSYNLLKIIYFVKNELRTWDL